MYFVFECRISVDQSARCTTSFSFFVVGGSNVIGEPM